MKLNLSFLKGGGGGTATADPPARSHTPNPQTQIRNAGEVNLAEAEPDQVVAALFGRMDAITGELAAEIEKQLPGEIDTHLCQQLENEKSDLRQALTKLLEERERRYSLPGSEPEENGGRKVNLAYIAHGLRTGLWPKDAGLEYEIWKNTRGARVPGVERQDMTAEPDSSVGYFIPPQQSGDWIDNLRAVPIVSALGATIIESPGPGYPFQIPRVVGDSVGKWGGETTAIETSDVTTGQLQLSPRGLRAATIVSNLALEHASVAMDQLIRMNHEEQLALGWDLGALNGDGANQPRGVIQTAGVNTVAFTGTGTKMKYTLAQQFPYKLRTSNALRGSLGWALNPDAVYHAQIAGNEGTGDGAVEMGRRMFTEGPLTNFVGYPFQTSTQLPTGETAVSGGTSGTAVFGAWTDLLGVIFKGVTVDVERGGKTLMLDDEVLVRTLMRADIGLRQKGSFCIATGYNAS